MGRRLAWLLCQLVLVVLVASCTGPRPASSPTSTLPATAVPVSTPAPTPLPTITMFPTDTGLTAWERAREEADTLSPTPVYTFTLLLQEALATGQVEPATLEEWLPTRRFTVTERLDTVNLMGDGRNVEVVAISPRDSWPTVALLALWGKEPGRYTVTPLRQDWEEHWRGKEQLLVVDTDGNGRPEVASIITIWGHACCGSKLALYEWQQDASDGHFRNIAEGIEERTGCYFNYSCEDAWSFGPSSPAGVQPVVETVRYTNWGGDACPPYQVTRAYTRTLSSFQPGAEQVAPLDLGQPPTCTVGWADTAAIYGEIGQAIPIVAAALEDWPAEPAKVWGPAARDYFRLRLGIWYANTGQVELARKFLEGVRDHPANPDFEMASRLAAAYLTGYGPDADADAGCVAVYDAVKYGLMEIQQQAGHWNDENIQDAWGFAEPYLSSFALDNSPFPWQICDPDMKRVRARFDRALPAFHPADKDQIADWFRELGLPVATVRQVNLIGEEAGDWLVELRTGFYREAEVLALLPLGDGWTAVEVVPYLHPKAAVFTSTLQVVALDENYPHVDIIQAEDRLVVFRLVRTEAGWEMEELFSDALVRDYRLDLTAQPPQLQVVYENRTVTYVWDGGGGKFVK